MILWSYTSHPGRVYGVFTSSVYINERNENRSIIQEEGTRVPLRREQQPHVENSTLNTEKSSSQTSTVPERITHCRRSPLLITPTNQRFLLISQASHGQLHIWHVATIQTIVRRSLCELPCCSRKQISKQERGYGGYGQKRLTADCSWGHTLLLLLRYKDNDVTPCLTYCFRKTCSSELEMTLSCILRRVHCKTWAGSSQMVRWSSSGTKQITQHQVNARDISCRLL